MLSLLVKVDIYIQFVLKMKLKWQLDCFLIRPLDLKLGNFSERRNKKVAIFAPHLGILVQFYFWGYKFNYNSSMSDKLALACPRH